LQIPINKSRRDASPEASADTPGGVSLQCCTIDYSINRNLIFNFDGAVGAERINPFPTIILNCQLAPPGFASLSQPFGPGPLLSASQTFSPLTGKSTLTSAGGKLTPPAPSGHPPHKCGGQGGASKAPPPTSGAGGKAGGQWPPLRGRTMVRWGKAERMNAFPTVSICVKKSHRGSAMSLS